jgi:nitrogen regulatory protein PII|tara:strand:+ start:168 stop:554 length:387 start_codon:yes stop_codon:yes gene_type:complete
MHLPVTKSDPLEYYLDYTWLIAGVLYQGGTDLLIPELMKRGNNEIYFYNVAGSPIGQKTVTGVASSFDVEMFHVVVSADQADNTFDFIYRFCELSDPNKGIIHINKLSRSTQFQLPESDIFTTDDIAV